MWKQQSPFKNVEEFPGVPVNDLRIAKPTSTASCMSASADSIAFTWGSIAGGSVAVWNSSNGTVRDFKAHNGPVTDLSYGWGMLASSERSGVIKVWDAATVEKSSVTVTGGGTSLAWHRAANNVLLVGGRKNVTIVDSSRSVVSSQWSRSSVGVDWAWDGSNVARVGTTGDCGVLDPRSGTHAINWNIKQLNSGTTIRWIDENHIVVFGQNAARGNACAILDTRVGVLWDENFDWTTGTLLPVLDWDSKLLFLSARGSSQLHMFDMNASLQESEFKTLNVFQHDTQFHGLCSYPKTSLNIADNEIVRIVQLTANSIQPLTMRATRTRRPFDIKIFPETASIEPAISSEEYFSGKNSPPALVSLDTTGTFRGSDSQLLDTPLKRALLVEVSAHREELDAMFKKSTFSNVKGKEPNSIEASWYKLKPSSKALPFGTSILCNSMFMFMPYSSVGGSAIAVFKTSVSGRTADNLPLIRCHGTDLVSFDINPFNDCSLVTGGVDGHVRLWQVPEDGLTEDLKDYILETNGIGKISCVKFHNSAKNVIAFSSSGYGCTSLQLYDITAQKSRIDITDHPQPISDFSFSSNGSLLATTCRDQKLRVYDPRTSTKAVVVRELCETLREARVLWLGETDHLMTYGFGRGSTRQLSLWDFSSLSNVSDTPRATYEIDSSNAMLLPYYDSDTGLVYVGGTGDRTIRVLSIDVGNPHATGEECIVELSSYTSDVGIKGLAWKPKYNLDVQNVEIASAYRLAEDDVKPVSFNLIRKRKEFFQDDVFPPTRSGECLYSSQQWFNGAISTVKHVSLQPLGMEALSTAPEEDLTQREKARIIAKAHMEETLSSNLPSVHDHVESYDHIAASVPKGNRWDAVPICSEVAEDEWSD